MSSELPSTCGRSASPTHLLLELLRNPDQLSLLSGIRVLVAQQCTSIELADFERLHIRRVNGPHTRREGEHPDRVEGIAIVEPGIGQRSSPTAIGLNVELELTDGVFDTLCLWAEARSDKYRVLGEGVQTDEQNRLH